MRYWSALLAVLLLTNQSEGHLIKNLYRDTETLLSSPVGADVGERLILTPLIREGRIEEAQEAALVNSIAFQGVVSYSAYFTVDEAFDSNIYFWFFPSAGRYNCSFKLQIKVFGFQIIQMKIRWCCGLMAGLGLLV